MPKARGGIPRTSMSEAAWRGESFRAPSWPWQRRRYGEREIRTLTDAQQKASRDKRRRKIRDWQDPHEIYMVAIRNGALATLGLLGLYAITMTVLSGWDATVEQFQALWFLMLPLAAGFGIQVFLYTRLKSCYHVTVHSSKGSTTLVAGGSSATIGMLACCAHHATDVLPFLGLSGISIFLTRYQIPFLAISLAINIVGIFVMLKHIRNSEIHFAPNV